MSIDKNEMVCVQVWVKGENYFIPMSLYWFFWDTDQVVAIWRKKNKAHANLQHQSNAP